MQNPTLFQGKKDEQYGEKKDLTASFGARGLALRNIKFKSVI